MDEIEYPKEDVQRLSVKYSVPEWILSLWKKEYGEEITEKMAADFQKEKPITIRRPENPFRTASFTASLHTA